MLTGTKPEPDNRITSLLLGEAFVKKLNGKMGLPHTKGLVKYWTAGPGLARWAMNPHPYTALTRALRKEGVPKRYVNGLAAEYFNVVFHMYPGERPHVKNKKKR